MKTNYPMHMLAIVDNVPNLLDHRKALADYVDHQKEIIQRRTEYRLREARKREHIVEGLVKALDMIDAIIAHIRGSEDAESARNGLMVAPFEFTEIQAQHILDMQLRQLTPLHGKNLLTTTAHSYLLFFSNRGKSYRLRAHEIPMKERTARGTALVNLLPLEADERIQAIIDTRTYEDGSFLFFATKNGVVKKTKMQEYDSPLARNGLIAINLQSGDELVKVIHTSGENDIFLVSKGGMTIGFAEADVRSLGRATACVRVMKFK